MRDLPAPPPCLLTRVHEGDPDSADALWLVLHERHGDIPAARALAQACLPAAMPRILVRSARMQTRGSLAPPKGPFWFIGPLSRPELSTLGDGLEQLERLVLACDRNLSLLGQGEGAVMAICLALLCPDRITALDLHGMVLPENLSRMPLTLPCPAPLLITLDQPHGLEGLQAIFPQATITCAAREKPAFKRRPLSRCPV